jgi:DNA-binding transcriptional LysR family regulator
VARDVAEANLRYFFEAVRLGSMRVAAEKLGVAVSSISRQITQLELDMGISLIEHGRRSIKLTEAGEMAFDYYRERVGQKEAFENRLADLKALRVGKIEIAIDEGFSATSMPSVLSQFMAKYVGLSLEVLSAGPRELVRMVAEDDVHLGLMFNPPSDPRLRVRTSFDAPLRVVVAGNHVLAGRDRLKLADLERFNLALPSGAFDIAGLLRDAERREGTALRPMLHTNSLALIKSMVLGGSVITLLPDFSTAGEVADGTLVSLRLADPLLSTTAISLVSRIGRQMPSAAGRLMTALETHLNSWNQPMEARRVG